MNMATFRKKILGGVERIFRDGSAVVDPAEIEKLPAVVRRLDPGDSIELETEAPLPPEAPIPQEPQQELTPPKSEPRVSIISGEPATRRRFLNGQEYWLTEEEYGQYNLGKLAQAIREKSTETVEE